MILSLQKPYEAPKVEVIEIESQGVLCASEGVTGRGGTQFGTNHGGW